MYSEENIMSDTLKILKKLVAPVSVSGREDAVRGVIAEEIAKYADSVTVDALGNLVAFIEGKGENKKKLMYAAHIDEIGFMVTYIEENGFIHVVGQDILAGAWFQNNRSVEYLVNNQLADFETAWQMCSTIPAALCGIGLPQLRCGDEASFVIAKFENRRLEIGKTVFRGREFIDKKND